jgi:hypothetical protein
MSTATVPAAPRAPIPSVGNIPPELGELPQWVLWRFEWRWNGKGRGRWTKVPYQARRPGSKARSDDPATWATFDEAWRAYRAGGFDGIGFMLDGRFVGWDLDHCVDAAGTVAGWALAIARELDSYTERSPGAGLRILALGELPPGRRRKGQVECYDRRRFLSITGRHLEGTPEGIEERTAQVASVHARIFPPKPKADPRPRPHPPPPDLDDAEIIRHATAAANGAKLAALYRGDLCGFPSHSEAVASLLWRLAFWTRDPATLDRLFRRSGLMEEKWDERRGDSTWGAREIAAALAGQSESYSGPRDDGRPEGTGPPESGPVDPRPEILITTEEHLVNDRAVDALRGEGNLFVRGNLLARVVRESGEPGPGDVARPVGTPRIAPVALPTLRELLARHARWQKRRRDRSGKSRVVAAHPPDWCVSAVAARGQWPGFRPLRMVVETPTIRPDGSVIDRPGYDPATAILYLPDMEYPAVPDRPTRRDARDAALSIIDLVAEFPFVGTIDQAVWLAGLLSVIARPAIDGPCPGFLVDANVAGVGKGLLIRVASLIASGREMSSTGYAREDAEMEKRITGIALAGDRMIHLDNVPNGGTIGHASLDRALTAPSWRERILGLSSLTPNLPLLTVWWASGNNITTAEDAERRWLPCRLESADEQPERRSGFAIPDLPAHVLSRRGDLIAAALLILRATPPRDWPRWARSNPGRGSSATPWTGHSRPTPAPPWNAPAGPTPRPATATPWSPGGPSCRARRPAPRWPRR